MWIVNQGCFCILLENGPRCREDSDARNLAEELAAVCLHGFSIPILERACAAGDSRGSDFTRCKRAVSWREGISPFHRKSSLAHLWRVCRGDAGELRAQVVDDVQIAVGPVVVPQAHIGTDGLRV